MKRVKRLEKPTSSVIYFDSWKKMLGPRVTLSVKFKKFAAGNKMSRNCKHVVMTYFVLYSLIPMNKSFNYLDVVK